MKKGQKLTDDDHVVRHVSWAKLRKDENDNVVGILGEAFKLRPEERSVSATWLEYFSGNRSLQIIDAVQAIRNSIKVRPKSGFAVGNVREIADACLACGYRIRILHEPEDNNAAHVGVHGLPRDDMQMLEMLAAEAWSELVLNSAIPENHT